MASQNKNAREQRKKNMIRVIAIVACVCLLLPSVLSLVASSMFR